VALSLDRLSVLCFAGTYALALAADLARVFTRVSIRWYLTLGLTILGWLVHTAYLALQLQTGWPVAIGGPRAALLGLAWILAAIDIYLVLRSPRNMAIGVFMLTLVLAAIGGSTMMPADNWAVWGGWISFWGQVHGILLTLGAVSTCLAFLFGLMYLWQSDRLKRKTRPRTPFALPSLELSDRWHRGAITMAFPLLTAGVLLGLGLILATRRAGADVVGWNDPKVLATIALWFVFTWLIHARYQPEMRGRRVMFLTVVAFAFMIFAMVGVRVLLPSSHGILPESSATALARPGEAP
jgi:ABC-type uncharacterized transport system permease subunit